MTEQKKTVGAASLEALQKSVDTRDPIELQRSMQEAYIDELRECVDKHVSSFDGDFFVVVITKRERILTNVLRNYFFARHSCPTPDYDQTVFRFKSATESIEYLWCIPDRETCLTFLENKNSIASDEQGLLEHIIDFSDGTLFNLCQRLNNEQRFSPFLEN